MALARKYQIIPDQPGFFHCYSRCVRRAFLCGRDPLSGKDFSHRRQWIVERLELLDQAFAVDIYAYAVMSNHVHLVLFIDPARTDDWSDEEVIKRWRSLYCWRCADRPSELPTPDQIGPVKLAVWRKRLGCVSWLMKSLNEPLARLANAEDECRGHFWEGRFGSTALLDEPAVLAAMAYVDLNPIRAGLSYSLTDSDFTSVQHRYRELCKSRLPEENTGAVDKGVADSDESPVAASIEAVFLSAPSSGSTQKLGVTLGGYLALVEAAAEEWLTGKMNVDDRAREAQRVLERYSLALPPWCQAVTDFERLFRRVAGAIPAVEQFTKTIGRQRRIDLAGARLLSAQ